MIDYDTDDFLQEGYILVWKVISNGGFKGGKFANYYVSAIRRRYISLYRSYTLKNTICISESEDLYHYGYQVCTLVESDYAKQYQEKHREQCKAWYERKKMPSGLRRALPFRSGKSLCVNPSSPRRSVKSATVSVHLNITAHTGTNAIGKNGSGISKIKYSYNKARK